MNSIKNESVKSIICITFFVLLLLGCKNNNSKQDGTIDNTIQQNTANTTSIKTELQKLLPLSNAQLQVAFPKKIKDLKIDKDPVVNGQTISSHFGERKISLGITDGAGDNYLTASYFLDALNDENFKDTSDTKYIKKERGGIQTFAKHYVGSHTELEFLYENRFLISLISKMNPDELWEAFDINSLVLFNKIQ